MQIVHKYFYYKNIALCLESFCAFDIIKAEESMNEVNVPYLRETDIGKGRNIAETNRKMIELSLR